MVRVDEAGEDQLAAMVDHLRADRKLGEHIGGVPDLRDAAVGQHEKAVLEIGTCGFTRLRGIANEMQDRRAKRLDARKSGGRHRTDSR